MVLYHWVNYFIGPQWEYYEYLRFLTPSFIFITGFLISNVYLLKYAAADSRLSKRLITRGFKLTGIFLVLNLSRYFLVPLLRTDVIAGNPFTPRNVFVIAVSGNLPAVGSKLISFSILLPISYVLVLSGALMLPYTFFKYTFHCVCLFLLSFILILGVIGTRSFNLEFVTIGMLGVLAGFTPIERINGLVKHPVVLAVCYLCYTVAITIWNVPFPLLVVGVLLSLMVIYLVGTKGRESNRVRNEVILLGKYSLFGYISQIAILQVLSVCFRIVHLGAAELIISFLAAFALTIVSVEVVDRARANMKSVDRLYKAVFA